MPDHHVTNDLLALSLHPLFRGPRGREWLQEDAQSQPLQQMNVEERLVADYGGTGLTIGEAPPALPGASTVPPGGAHRQ